MRYLHYFFLVGGLPLFGLSQDDTAYQKALEEAIRDYPPGDYNSPVVRRIHISQAPVTKPTTEWTLEQELLRPVEMPNRDASVLSSEAARYFTQGRWDLAFKRYKQILLLDPENAAAKVSLYDIIMLRSLYSADAKSRETWIYYDSVRKRILKELPQFETK